MARKKFDNNTFNYNNTEKKNKNFMYQNLQRSKCYNTNFPNSNFDFVSFRGAHLKSCSFFECSFKGTEFVGTNLKDSSFRKARFENTVFEGVKLDNVNFIEATFKNTIFVASNVADANNINLENPEIRVFDKMPELDMSNDLKVALEKAIQNEFIKRSRTLDTKDKTLNTISVMILLEQFEETALVSGLEIAANTIDKDFYALSYLIKLFKRLQKEEQM